MTDLDIIQLVFSVTIIFNLVVVIYLVEKRFKLLSQRLDNQRECIKVLKECVDLLDERTWLSSRLGTPPSSHQE